MTGPGRSVVSEMGIERASATEAAVSLSTNPRKTATSVSWPTGSPPTGLAGSAATTSVAAGPTTGTVERMEHPPMAVISGGAADDAAPLPSTAC